LVLRIASESPSNQSKRANGTSPHLSTPAVLAM
jgi:hypothetical protein